MKGFLSILVAFILSVFVTTAQDNKYQTTYTTTNKDSISVSIDVKTSDVKLPMADVNILYAKIEDLKEANKTEYSAVTSKLDAINSKIDNIVYKESDTKVTYIAENFNMTKDDINTAIRRSSTYTIIAILPSFLLVIVLWWQLYNYRRADAKNTTIFVFLSLVMGLATFAIIKFGLEALFNHDMAVLKELQKLL